MKLKADVEFQNKILKLHFFSGFPLGNDGEI